MKFAVCELDNFASFRTNNDKWLHVRSVQQELHSSFPYFHRMCTATSDMWLQVLSLQWYGLPTFGTCKDVVCSQIRDQSPSCFSALVESALVLCNKNGKDCSSTEREIIRRVGNNLRKLVQRANLHQKACQPHCFSIVSGVSVWTKFKFSIPECRVMQPKVTRQKEIGNNLRKLVQRANLHQKACQPHCFSIVSGVSVWTKFKLPECRVMQPKVTRQKEISYWPA